MISFDMYDTCSLIKHHGRHNFSWEAKATLLGAIFEASQCMLGTMNLTYSDDMEDRSFEKEVEIGIIGIRKELKNLIV